jgi:GNAT superfamily N-acetyltransferase
MNAGISIRIALETDTPAISDLSERLGYPAALQVISARIQKILARNDQLLLVALLGQQVCGWLQAHATETIESGARVEILGLIVGEQARRRGLGRLLVEHTERWAAEIGAEAVVVRTNIARAASQTFYQALGYSHSKTQAVYRKPLPRVPLV